jgi:hypothetical protein
MSVALAAFSQVSRVKISPLPPSVLTDVFLSYPQWSGKFDDRSQPLPATSFPVYYPLINAVT